MIRSVAAAVLLAFLVQAPPLAMAQERGGGTTLTPRQREDERKAMSAFAAGRYQEALDTYAELYADFRDPIYLRNIGRCQYKLKRPEEAISSFEEYLLKYKRISAAEREEVQGWIREMKALREEQARTPPPPPAPPPAPAPAPEPTPAPAPAATPAPPAPAPAAAPPPAAVTTAVPPPPRQGDNVMIRRIGFGALILGAALAATGGVFEALAWSKYDASDENACVSAAGGCDAAADTIQRHNTLSKIFFIGGAAAGLAGGAMIVLFPVSEPTRPASVAGVGASATVPF
jgi:tetratricopeptide (TPR) repeat protein